MPLTEDDFRTLLAERAATASPPVDRVASVHRRIVRRRRRRQAATGAVLGAVLLAGGAALPQLGSHPRTPTATTAPAPRPLLAEYLSGGRLLASGVLHSPDRGELTFQFTPTDWHLQILDACAAGWPPDTWTEVRVNGHLLTVGNGCGMGSSAPYGEDQAHWSKLGVRLGQPSTVTVSLVQRTSSVPPDPAPLPVAQRPTGRYAAGVYQRVPLADYPLPPRPATLQPLSRVAGPGTLDSRDVGANGTSSVRATVGSRTEIRATTVAPGALRLLVDGRPINEIDSWRWDTVQAWETNLDQDTLRAAGVHVPDGATVTVTVEASRFAVPGWTLEVRAPGPNGDGG